MYPKFSSTLMNKKLKASIKRVVEDGLSLIMNKLKISKPSSKLKRSIKKQSKRLVDHLKDELKRQNRKKGNRAVVQRRPLEKRSKN